MDPQLLKGLNSCQRSCKSAFDTLSRSQRNDSQTITAPPPGLDDVLAQLLANLRQTVTSLGLAFKPPTTIPAALDLLDKITDQIGRLISCVLIAIDGEAQFVAEEWKGGMVEIGWEVDKHLDVLKTGGDYLSHTGMLWEVIDRLAQDLPRDDKSAVARRLKTQQSLVKDAWAEFKEILEDDDNDEQDEDEWDEEDDFGLSGKLSAEERRRTEVAKPLLALHQLLFGMIPRFLDDVRDYAALVKSATRFIDAFDAVVSAMHPGQDEKEIEDTMEQLGVISREMADLVGSSHLNRWAARLGEEQKAWEERRLNLGSLSRTLE